ncbi:MAG TPA: DUF3267 domain-containing protein [Bacteroidales bacterium]|nr:DUF3267 domain-containing protein [Bacteroidales bacterium]
MKICPEQISIFVKTTYMKLKVEDLEDQSRYRHLMTLQYTDIVPFVLDYIRRTSIVTIFFWSTCLIAILLTALIRFNISGFYEFRQILPHTLLGLILLPVLVIPVHEFLHVIPFVLTGARNIKIGMDMRQFIFYVTVHREVVTPGKFKFVAVVPFITITIVLLILILVSPPLWKWSLSLFLFVHTTMCAGDFAMLNFYHINRHRKILSWDDADLREAYFYEEIQ